MTEYKRFVSYIYAYDKGIKNKNVGFAKVEARNGQCKLSINVKGAFSGSGRDQEVYLFHREGEDLLGTYMGSFQIKNGIGEFRESTDTENIKNSGLSLDEMNGILIRNTEDAGHVYASGWDDQPILVERFLTSRAERVMEETAAAAELIPEIVPEPVVEIIREVKPEITEAITETVTEPVPEVKQESLAPAAEQVISEENQPVREPTVEIQDLELKQAKGREKISLWDRLENTFPKVVAFEDEPDIICLKIDLKDLEYLPRENWILGNNSFLLHGFYNFRYLLLAKMAEGKYMLGVPGMFHNNERFMAAMFGFDHFKPVKEYKQLTGHFGYWYQWIKL